MLKINATIRDIFHFYWKIYATIAAMTVLLWGLMIYARQPAEPAEMSKDAVKQQVQACTNSGMSSKVSYGNDFKPYFVNCKNKTRGEQGY